jgi:hypothetical protein
MFPFAMDMIFSPCIHHDKWAFEVAWRRSYANKYWRRFGRSV